MGSAQGLTWVQRWRLHPHREALVRLKYANILFEETDNNSEAELNLTKGVRLSLAALCVSRRSGWLMLCVYRLHYANEYAVLLV